MSDSSDNPLKRLMGEIQRRSPRQVCCSRALFALSLSLFLVGSAVAQTPARALRLSASIGVLPPTALFGGVGRADTVLGEPMSIGVATASREFDPQDQTPGWLEGQAAADEETVRLHRVLGFVGGFFVGVFLGRKSARDQSVESANTEELIGGVRGRPGYSARTPLEGAAEY